MPSPAKVGREHRGVARHREAREGLARHAGERVERVALAGLVDHVVEERAEGGAGQLGRGVGDACTARSRSSSAAIVLPRRLSAVEGVRLLAQRAGRSPAAGARAGASPATRASSSRAANGLTR